MRPEKRKRQVIELSEKKKNAREARSVHAGRKRRSRSERRKKGRTENERSERSENKEIEIERRKNERTGNVRTEEIATEESTIRRGDTKMMMVTEEMRGTIASGIAIAIALLAIGPLIVIARAMTVSQIMMVGPECRTGEKRARVSPINSLNLITFRLQCS